MIFFNKIKWLVLWATLALPLSPAYAQENLSGWSSAFNSDSHQFSSPSSKGHSRQSSAEMFSDTSMEIRDRIGKGGQGEVRRARRISPLQDLPLNCENPLAIKTGDRSLENEYFALRNFATTSPVVKVIELRSKTTRSGSQKYALVMEEASHGSLQNILDDGEVINPLSAGGQELFRQMVMGIHVIHSHGWVHRDIKPANLLLHQRESDDRLTVLYSDFGLAELVLGAKVSVDKFVGSPLFAAPELHRRDNAEINGYQADHWSLGATMFTLASGQPPQTSSLIFTEASARTFKQAYDRTPENIFLSTAFFTGTLAGLENSKPKLNSDGLGRAFTTWADDPEAQLHARIFLNLLHGLLHPDPKQRLSMEKALFHPYWSLRLPESAPQLFQKSEIF